MNGQSKVSVSAEDATESERPAGPRSRTRFPANLPTVVIILFALCLVGWTAIRLGGVAGREGAGLTLAAIEWFGWTAICLGILCLATLAVTAFAAVRRRLGLRTILPWVMVLLMGGLAYWGFDGIRIAAIGCHAALMAMSETRDQAFQLAARWYPLLPYIGLQTALMPEPVWAFWHAGRMVTDGTLWLLYLWFTTVAAIGIVGRQWKDPWSWLLLVPSVAGLGYLIFQALAPSTTYALVAPWFSVNAGPVRTGILASNFVAVMAATLSLFAGLQTYRLVRSFCLAQVEG